MTATAPPTMPLRGHGFLGRDGSYTSTSLVATASPDETSVRGEVAVVRGVPESVAWIGIPTTFSPEISNGEAAAIDIMPL
nr:unnamed protein product [Digitaria exilis]